MSHRKWQSWRGTEAKVGAETPADGEFIYETDTKRLRIGDGSTAGGNRVVMKADKDAADYGLSFEGVVTTATSNVQFSASVLADFPDNYFKGYYVYPVWDAGEAGGAPQGEHKLISAYTGTGGVFVHGAFTSDLALTDKVLIVHPNIAQLADLIADWKNSGRLDNLLDAITAAGPTNAQLNTAIGLITAVTDNLPNSGALTDMIATLGAITAAGPTQAQMNTAHGLLATPAQVATALNTYDAVKRSEATTDKEDIIAEVDANETLIGAKDDTASAGVLVDTESMFALLRRLATSGSLVHFGDITAIDAGVSSTIADLIGWEDDYFLGWWMMIVRDNAGAGAAPQGEYRQITSYTSTTGLMNHAAFGTADVVGDQAMLIHPLLYRMFAATAGSGPRSLETLGMEQDAGLDVARGTSGAVTVDGNEDDLYDESSDTEFVLLELRVDLNNMVEGDTITFRVYTTEDGTERLISDDDANTFTGPQTKPRVEIVGSTNQVWGREGIRICAVNISGGNRDVTAYWRDAKRGS